MRISWLSNAPWVNTGYGKQTRLFIPRLQAQGHPCQVTAFYGLEGGVLNWNDIPVYPKGTHPYGADVMSAHAAHFHADILISLIDSWVYEPTMFQGIPWVPWFPVDHDPIPPPVSRRVQGAFARIVYTRFAQDKVQEAGLECFYVPHGVDCEVFKPGDRAAFRESLKLPPDKFIIGMVAANKGYPPRKAFQQNLAAFAKVRKSHPDALLYLHTETSEIHAGMNIVEFVESLGLSYGYVGRCDHSKVDVLFPDQYALIVGIEDAYLNAWYNSMDVLLSVTMGEGFGLPILEAQASGAPVIVGDWTSMPEITFSGWKVPRKEAEPYWTQLASYQFLPHTGAIADCLEAAYQMRGNQDYRDRARDGALRYQVDKIVERDWLPTLQTIQERLDLWKPKLAS